MEQLQKWVALAALASVAIVTGGWFLLVSPKRGEAADLRAQADEQTATNSRLGTELQVLQAQAKELPKEQAKLAAVSTKIPDNPALPSLVRALLDAAASTGVELVSVSPGQPELVAPVVPAAVEAPAEGQATPEAPDAPVDPSVAGAAAPGPAGQLATIALTVNVFGDYFEVQQFTAALEGLPRALRVTTLNVSPGASPTAGDSASTSTEDGRSLTTTINGLVFMAANRPAATAVTVPGDAAPADAPADAAAVTATTAE